MVSWAVGQCILVVWLMPLFPQNPCLTGSFFTQFLQRLIDLILWSMRCLRKSQVYCFVFINCLPQQQCLASRIFPLITQMSHLSKIEDPFLFMVALQHKDIKICVLMGIHSDSGWKLVFCDLQSELSSLEHNQWNQIQDASMDTLVAFLMMWLKRLKALMSNLEEKGLILAPSSRIKYIIVEKSGQWELNGAGHIVLPWTSRKGWMHINCLTLFSNYTVQNHSQGTIPSTMVGLPISVELPR